MLVRFIYGAVCRSSSLTFIAMLSIIWGLRHLFAHLAVDGHLGCIPWLVIMMNAAMNILVNICWCTWARSWDCKYLEGHLCIVAFAYFNLVHTPKQFSRVTEPIFVRVLVASHIYTFKKIILHILPCLFPCQKKKKKLYVFAKKGRWPFWKMNQFHPVPLPAPKQKSSTKLASWKFFTQKSELLAFHQTAWCQGTAFLFCL